MPYNLGFVKESKTPVARGCVEIARLRDELILYNLQTLRDKSLPRHLYDKVPCG